MAILELILAVLGATAGVISTILGVVVFQDWRRQRKRVTWDDALRVADKLLKKIPRGDGGPKVVIGLGRSGGIWGGWLAGNLGSLPFAVVDIKYPESETSVEPEFPGAKDVLGSIRNEYGEDIRVLLIEGATTRGTTITKFLDKYKSELGGWTVEVAVLYRNSASDAPVHFVGKDDLTPWPTKAKPFPWHDTGGYRPFLARVITGGT